MDKKSLQMTIAFNSAEDDTQHCYETNGANVTVQVSPRSSTNNSHGSSMVKLKNVIGYKWEVKNYAGHLVAVHKDGKIIAYSINVGGVGMVRIHNSALGGKRGLMKGMKTECLDLQFANSSKEIIFGCIETTALHVYKVLVENNEMNCERLVTINSTIPGHIPELDKISFCPYVPESESEKEDELSVLLLIWVRGKNFECYSIKDIIEKYGTGIHQAENITEGIVKSYDSNRALITSVSFSPDGTHLAIGTQDGFIRFYQIYLHQDFPTCMHSWNAHDGLPISNFFFLDNQTQPIPDKTLWKYVVTLANNNTEIKVTSCDEWKVLQTIQFKSTTGQPLSFKAEIDRTASYLILSDMSNRQIYVLHILKENALSQNGDDEHSSNNGNNDLVSNSGGGIARVFVKSIAEFHLASTILSYAISNASIRRYKCALSENYMIDELEDFDEENIVNYCVVLKLFIIFPESVQECHIFYQAANQCAEVLNTEITDVAGSSSTSVAAAAAALQLLNVSTSSSSANANIVDVKKNDLALTTPPQKATQLNLLTPDSFSSPIEKTKSEVNQDVLNTIYMLAKNNQTSPGIANKSSENIMKLANVSLIEEEKIYQQTISAPEPPMPLKFASGGSSPSREVRDILLKADSANEDFYPQEDDDDDDIDLDEPVIHKVQGISGLNSMEVAHFKNIDDDDDDDDGNEEDDEDDEPDEGIIKSKTKNWPKAPQFINSDAATSEKIDKLSERMNLMIEVMEKQSQKIAELNSEITSLKAQTNAESMITQKYVATSEENIRKAIEQSYMRYETLLLNRENHKQRELSESIVQLFQQMQRSQMQQIDTSVKESLTLKSSTLANSMSASILNGIQKPLEQIFKKSLQDNMIPSYEKITNEMFQEMGKAFTAGTKEYTRAFDSYMKQYGAVQFHLTEFSSAIHNIPKLVNQELKTANEQSIIPVLNTKFLTLKQTIEGLQAKMMNDVKEHVRNEIQSGFELQKTSLSDSVLSAVRSQAETPAPTIVDNYEIIKQLLAQGNVNKAFMHALSTNDLSVVEFTIEKADFAVVFSTPCPLDQNVILSLIQQVTADMNRYSEIKNRCLNEAIVNLDMHNSISRQHAPKILLELYNKFQAFITANPTNPLISSMKMVMLAAQSFATLNM